MVWGGRSFRWPDATSITDPSASSSADAQNGATPSYSANVSTHVSACFSAWKSFANNSQNSVPNEYYCHGIDAKRFQSKNFERDVRDLTEKRICCYVESEKDLNHSVTMEEYEKEFNLCATLQNQLEVQVKDDELDFVKEEVMLVADDIDIKVENVIWFQSDIVKGSDIIAW